MNTKKLLFLSAAMFSLLLVAGCGTKTTTTSDATTSTTPTTTATTTNATKDQCIELMAYAFKVAQLQAQGNTADMATWAQKANDIELQLKAKNLEYEQACNKYLANTADTSFYNDVQKRVKELK